MADQEEDRAGLLRKTGEIGCTLPHLADVAGGGGQLLRVHHLDGIDYQHSRLVLIGGGHALSGPSIIFERINLGPMSSPDVILSLRTI